MEPLSSSCPPRDVSAGPSLSSGPGSSKHCPGRQEELVSLPSSSPPVEVASGLSSSSAALTVQGKLFVGGISSETGEALLVEHFAEYGELREVTVIRDRITGNSRGFGFVRFVNPDNAESALKEAMHVIDGKTNNYHELKGKFVDVKVAIPKNDNNYTNNRNNNNYGSSSIGGGGGRRWPIYDAYQGCYHATHGYCGPGSCGITLYGYQFVSPLNDPRWMPTLVTYYPYVMGGSGSNMPAHDHLLFHASDDSNGDYCYTNGDTLK
nr:PREDICTED: RNA-binding protein 1-like [Musa acuminata subsp. malaccensis]